MISKFLPEPVYCVNPHYRCASPMKLYEKEVVLRFMETEEFAQAMAKATKKKSSAQKAVATKAENLRLEMLDIADHITVEILPDDDLRKKTIEAKKIWHSLHRRYHRYSAYNDYNDYDDYDNDSFYDDSYQDDEYYYENDYEEFDYDNVSESTMNRWVVNYIRHNLIKYDEALRKLHRKIGKDNAYVDFKNAILERIAKIYPKYAEECRNQKLTSKLKKCA